MATGDDHIACANRTQLTIKHLLNDPVIHFSWIAATAFYKALHLVEAVFANEPAIGHSCDHGARESALKKERKYARLCKHYLPLSRAATIARYLEGVKSFDNYLSPQQVVDQLLKHHLKQVESAAKRFVQRPDALDSISEALSQ